MLPSAETALVSPARSVGGLEVGGRFRTRQVRRLDITPVPTLLWALAVLPLVALVLTGRRGPIPHWEWGKQVLPFMMLAILVCDNVIM